MPEKLDRCVEKLKKDGHDEDSAWAICQDSVKKGFSDEFYSVKYSWKAVPFEEVPSDPYYPELSEEVYFPELEWEGSAITGEAMEHGEPKGTIVAVPVPSYISECLYMAGGEPPYEMHITLAYIEPFLDPELEIEVVRDILSEAAELFSPFTAQISGLGRFSTHEEQDVLYASVDSPELGSIREFIVDSLEANGVIVSKEHGFTPHCTIKYISKDEPTPLLSEDALKVWMVETLDLWHRNFRYKYGLHNDML